MKEKLQEYALIAEIVSAIAVVLSLVYVGYQVQMNTEEKRMQSVQSLNTANRELAMNLVNNEKEGIAWHKVLDGEELSKRELDLMTDALYSHLMVLEDTYNKYQEGYIDAEFLQARVNLTRVWILQSPQLRQRYVLMKQGNGVGSGGIFTHSFMLWLDGELQKSNENTTSPQTNSTQVSNGQTGEGT